MAFSQIKTGHGARANGVPDIWEVFRALRDARTVFGLKPSHFQTLQAMLSFLKPGQGETIFASNQALCKRAGGIDERTIRRHISRLIKLGFAQRHDSPNGKRFRTRSSEGTCISYGITIAPLLARAEELLALAQKVENERRDCAFLRKKILQVLSLIEAENPNDNFSVEAKRQLRRKLTLAEHRAMLEAVEAYCAHMSTAVDIVEPQELSANDGQNVRHLSKSIKEKKDKIEGTHKVNQDQIEPHLLTTACTEATEFASHSLTDWHEIDSHARTLAPMLGLHPEVYTKAREAVGVVKTACALFITIQLGKRVKDYGAYFHSLTLGRHASRFNPKQVLQGMIANTP